jgi:7-cyano-7-deazaguanine synthase
MSKKFIVEIKDDFILTNITKDLIQEFLNSAAQENKNKGENLMSKKVVISLSGGMDSTTLLGYYIDKNYEVFPVSFNYGSKHNKYELEAVKNILKHYKLENKHKLIDLSFIGKLFKSNLLVDGGDIPEGHYSHESMKQTVVPNRNMIFASILAGYADSINANHIALGVHSGDHQIYPDCRIEFINELNNAIKLSTEDRISILTPFITYFKKDILEIGYNIDVPYHLTRTCYKSQKFSCGKCGSCNERLEAFGLIGKKDPITYETECSSIIENKKSIVIYNDSYSITKKFKFECSHRLNVDYNTPCLNLHGHSYTVKLTIGTTSLNKNDMVIDFSHLKRFKNFIEENLDHSTLVYIKDEKLLKFITENKMKGYILDHITTSENIARLLCEKFELIYHNKIKDILYINVEIAETEGNSASYLKRYFDE